MYSFSTPEIRDFSWSTAPKGRVNMLRESRGTCSGERGNMLRESGGPPEDSLTAIGGTLLQHLEGWSIADAGTFHVSALAHSKPVRNTKWLIFFHGSRRPSTALASSQRDFTDVSQTV